MVDYYWVANYNDGTKLRQFDPEVDTNSNNVKENKYIDIDRTRLSTFELWVKDRPDIDLPIVKIHLEPDKRLIFRRRGFIHITRDGRIDNTIYLLGWQKVVQGENVQSIVLLFDDGRIELIGKWKEGIYCEPNLLDNEK